MTAIWECEVATRGRGAGKGVDETRGGGNGFRPASRLFDLLGLAVIGDTAGL